MKNNNGSQTDLNIVINDLNDQEREQEMSNKIALKYNS